MTPHLRPARHGDIDRLVEIESRVFFHDRISRRSFRRLIDRLSAGTTVAEIDGKVAGYCTVLYRQGTGVARLYSIAVHPDAAGAGAGRALLAAAQQAARSRGCRAMRLEVRVDNGRAIALYRTAGFAETGRADGYYADGETAIRMEKLLGQQAAIASHDERHPAR